MKSALSFLIAARRSEIAGLQRLALTSELVGAIGRLVHALQRERGLSNLYLGSRGQRWAVERSAQVAQSEALQDQVLRAFEQLDTDAARSGHRARLFGRIAYAMQGMSALPRLRERVALCQWSTDRTVAAYARLIQALLGVVFEAADSAWDPEISRHLVAFLNFLQGKEFAGQERATGSALFAAGRADADSQQRLLHFIESQERCLQVCTDLASTAIRDLWRAAQQPEHLMPLERMRRILCTTASGGTLDAALSQPWFDACTRRIDAMKTVEDALAAELQGLCSLRLETTARDLAGLERMAASLLTEPGQEAPDFFDDATEPGLPADLAGAGSGFAPPMDPSLLELVREQARRLQSMGEELDAVRATLNERKTIERAKGLLMAHRQLSEDQAHKTMRQMAMNQNRRLIDVAEAVLAMADVLPSRG